MTGADLAAALWGRVAVERALTYRRPSPLTAELRSQLAEHLTDDATLAAWARGLDDATFATVVRLVAGETRADLLAALQAGDGGGAH